MREIRLKWIDGAETFWGDDFTRCAGPHDQTSGLVAYDSKCAACWLGHGHTQAYHDGFLRLIF